MKKYCKKAFSLVLVLTLAFVMVVPCFAAVDDGYITFGHGSVDCGYWKYDVSCSIRRDSNFVYCDFYQYVLTNDKFSVTPVYLDGFASFVRFGYALSDSGSLDIYDDYAHHPGELHALLTTAKTLGYQRLIVAFQPHTYTRTQTLFQDFVRELQLPDVTILAEIFAAREQNTLGISSADLCRNIPGSIYCSTLDKVTEQLRQIAQPGDLILTVGAGDIYRAGEKLLKKE